MLQPFSERTQQAEHNLAEKQPEEKYYSITFLMFPPLPRQLVDHIQPETMSKKQLRGPCKTAFWHQAG